MSRDDFARALYGVDCEEVTIDDGCIALEPGGEITNPRLELVAMLTVEEIETAIEKAQPKFSDTLVVVRSTLDDAIDGYIEASDRAGASSSPARWSGWRPRYAQQRRTHEETRAQHHRRRRARVRVRGALARASSDLPGAHGGDVRGADRGRPGARLLASPSDRDARDFAAPINPESWR